MWTQRTILRLATAALTTLSLWGQQPNGTIRGVVTDPEGLSVQGAQVRVVSGETGYVWNSETDPTGFFVVTVPPGDEYSATVTAEGFQRYRQTGISMTVHGQVRLDINLAIGEVEEEVVVTDAPPLLNTDDGRLLGEVISKEELVQLPSVARSQPIGRLQLDPYESLALTVPGVVTGVVATTPSGARMPGLSINGARADQTAYYVDGISNRNSDYGGQLVTPNIYAVREFRVETTGYSPKYGRFGGGVVEIALRSGTNQLHGDLFEDLKHDALNSRNIFQRTNGLGKDDFKDNTFGASLGGPVWLPRLYDGRNRSFFYLSYQGNRRSSDNRGGTETVPTRLERRGDFSQSDVDIFEYPSTQPFTNGLIPQSRLDPIGLGVAGLYPLPNYSGATTYNRISGGNQRYFDDRFSLKLDHRIGGSDLLSFRTQHVGNRLLNFEIVGEPPAWSTDDATRGWSSGISYAKAFSPSLLMQVQYGFGHSTGSTAPINLGAAEAREIGIPVATDDPEFYGMPAFFLRGYKVLGPNFQWPNSKENRDQQLQVSFDQQRGEHTLTWGGVYSRALYSNPLTSWIRGSYSFYSGYSGSGLSDLLLGLMDGSSRRRDPGYADLQTSSYAFFLNDDWRLSSRLTLNLGFRYAVNPPFVEKRDRLGNFSPDLAKLVIADDRHIPELEDKLATYGGVEEVTLARQAGLPRGLAETDYGNFSPRVGFAWRPFRDSKTVVRSGYGIFEAGTPLGLLRERMADFYPITFVEGYSARETPMSFSDPFSRPPNGSRSVGGVGVEVRQDTPYLQSWNFTIERAIGWRTTIEAGYVGSKGTHLSRWRTLNDRIRTLELYEPDRPFVSPDDRYGPKDFLTYDSDSNYHAAQFSIRRRAAGGSSFERTTHSRNRSTKILPSRRMGSRSCQTLPRSIEAAPTSIFDTSSMRLGRGTFRLAAAGSGLAV